MTRNIVCCKEPEESTQSAEEGVSQQTEESSGSNSEVHETVDTSSKAEASVESSLTSAEQSVLDIMHPLWFGKKHGWQGTTYDDAVEFCKNVGGMSLCPLEGEASSTLTLFLLLFFTSKFS
jgi:hypothetical protein